MLQGMWNSQQGTWKSREALLILNSIIVILSTFVIIHVLYWIIPDFRILILKSFYIPQYILVYVLVKSSLCFSSESELKGMKLVYQELLKIVTELYFILIIEFLVAWSANYVTGNVFVGF